MVKDVQSWLDHPEINHGWVISQRPGNRKCGLRFLAARESAESAPKLTVEFTAPPDALAETAQYKVIFRAAWSQRSHPRDFPPNAHWSGIVGGLHHPTVNFWSGGRTASEGIRDMAELGAQGTLLGEVEAAIANGSAHRTLAGSGINRGSGRTDLQFTANRSHPLITLTSMIAPSPDWFVGVHDLPLVEKGEWGARKSAALYPYDAGTDSGGTFRSPDRVTDPRGVVSRISTRPLSNRRGNTLRIGTFVFVRESP
ncbi:MAG: spondin domain-containing protein [Chthoniobacteraceae bacterium]